MAIILTGFMGTGKTTIGRRLAHELGKEFIDTDERIEQLEGRSIAAIFAADGEASFREIERSVVAAAVKRDAVVATGGGAIADPANYACMHEAGPIVCLTADIETILQRAAGDEHCRPLLEDAAPPARVRQLLSERAAAYAQADVTIDTSEASVEAVVREIRSFLHTQERKGVRP